MMTDGPLVALNDLAVRYGRTRVLEGVSFTVPRGAVYALLGRNGAGKSSIVRCCLGLQRPSGGAVRLFGRDPWAHRVDLLRRTGFVPEQAHAPGELTAPQLVALCRRLHATWDDETTRDRLARFAIPDRVRFDRLSKGQQGAVALALALGHTPDLLLLDDPTLGLDIVAKDELFGEIIRDLSDRGTTILMTTHDLRLAEGLATHVGILAGHRLVIDAELETLKVRQGRSLEDIFIASARGSEVEA